MSFTINSKRLLILTISVQIMFVLSFILSRYTDIFIFIRLLSGFIYLTFVPGSLILYLLRLEVKKPSEFVIYSIGLSLSFMMFLGFIINFSYPVIGITSKPISGSILLVSFILSTLILWLISWKFKKNFLLDVTNNLFELKKAALLLFLPFFSVFGAYYLNYYNDNIILLVLLILVLSIPFVELVIKFDSSVHPFILLLVSISLLLQNSLIPPYIRYGDAEIEYYISNLVKINGFWNPSLPRNKNAMLGIALVHPIYSILCDIGLVWVYKVIYPIIFSFIVVVLYNLFKNQTGRSDISFISTYFFMGSYMFFTWLSKSTRQGLAEFFLALLMLSITHPSISRLNKAILVVIFSFSLVTSHYGTSYIFMFILIISLIIINYYYFTRSTRRSDIFGFSESFCIYYIVLALGWYIYTSSSSIFDSLLTFGKSVSSTVSTKLLSPRASFTLYVLEKKWVFSLQVLKFLYIFIILLATVGVISYLIHKYYKYDTEQFNFDTVYIIFSTISLGIVLMTVLPIVSKKITTDRVFIIAQIFIAPFIVIGYFEFFKFLRTLKNNKGLNLTRSRRSVGYICILIILAVFFLFNSGLSSEIVGGKDYTPSILLSKSRAINGKLNTEGTVLFYKQYISEYDVFGSMWFANHADVSKKLFSSNWIGAPGLPYGFPITPWGVLVQEYIGYSCPRYEILKNNTKLIKNSYIYIGYPNVVNHIMVLRIHHPQRCYSINEITPVLVNCSKIYTNRIDAVYYH